MPKTHSLKQALTGYQSIVSLKAAEKQRLQAQDLKKGSINGQNVKDKRQRRREREEDRMRADMEREKEELDRKYNEQLVEAGEEGTVKKVKGKGKLQTYPFEKDDTILLIGEANFSYALALLQAPHNHQAHLILATSYDSEETCYTKYPDSEEIVQRIRGLGGKVQFEVDGRYLERYPSVTGSTKSKRRTNGEKWSKIVFNFPHVGAGIKDQDRNILTNQEMLMSFLKSASGQLSDGPGWFDKPARGKGKGRTSRNTKATKGKKNDNDDDDDEEQIDQIKEVDDDMELENEGITSEEEEDQTPITNTLKRFVTPHRQGTILITLRNAPPYTLWEVPRLATHPPRTTGIVSGQPRYRICRFFAFDPALYPGYEHRRTLGFKEGVSKGGNEEILRGGGGRTWEFALRNDKE